MVLSQLVINNGKINTDSFISSIGGTKNLYNFLKKWSKPDYSKQRYLDYSWGLLPDELEKANNRDELWNNFIINLLNNFHLGNTVVQHQNGNIDTWIAGMGLQSYGLTLDNKIKEFSSQKFTLQTLVSSKSLKTSIEQFIRNQQQSSLLEKLYSNKIYCFDTILNPITETEIGNLLKDELGFVEESNVILQQIKITNELLANLPEIDLNYKVLNPLEILKTMLNENKIFNNRDLGRIETKKKKEVRSGFENIYDFRVIQPNRENFQQFQKLLDVNKFLLDQFSLVHEFKIIGEIGLNLLPIYEKISIPIRRINTLVSESEKAQNQLLGYVIKYLYQKGVRSLVMVVGANSPDRKILEQFRGVSSFEQTLLTIYRKEGPDYKEINNWINQAETVDYIEIAKQRLNIPPFSPS